MELKEKNVLVLGLGISGVSTAKALNRLGANVFISDLKTEKELKHYLDEISSYSFKFYLGTNNVPLDDIDLIIKSPGIPFNASIIKRAEKSDIEVITDIELAYRLKPDSNFIAITGTNGKTTTTTLIGEFFKRTGYNCYVAGNIGVGILEDVINSTEKDIFVIEVSSFQLQNTKEFKPKGSLLLNITPDHINWHLSYKNYINAKKKVFLNQDEEDFTVFNYDDPVIRNMKNEVKSNLYWFSVEDVLDRGVCIKDEYIVIRDEGKETKVLPCEDIKIPGRHNLENILGSICIGWLMGLDVNIMVEVLRNFEGLEHRIEYVTSINGISFYNDSKGTNPVSSIEAVKALKNSIILIAGGQDKGSSFDEFVEAFHGRVKCLILLGETAEKIKKTALKYGFEKIYIVKSMTEAVKKGYELSEKGDKILLSPACSSWDMYESYEKRGLDFKKAVMSLKED